MPLSTKYRSTAIEIMDDMDMEGELLRSSLDKIAAINQWLGGNTITINAIQKMWQYHPKDQVLRVIDLGCGNGDMLRAIAKKARKENRKIALIGIDANDFTVNYAQMLSQNYPEISYKCQFIPSPEFEVLKYDIALSTLFLHHFADSEIKKLLGILTEKAQLGIIINDLHRHWLAYRLFQFITLFIPNKMIRSDGLISILKGFKKQDLKLFSEQMNQHNSQISWRWAFRYLWVIKK